MIKFFRKIRQKLLTQNKFSQYLIYAIGEIILVVIGILIALQINNWNETRKSLNAELQIYGKIINDLNTEYSTTINDINWMNISQNAHYSLYNESAGNIPFDSTKSYNILQWVFPFHLSISEKYTKSLTNISDDEIRELIKSYMAQEKKTNDAYDEWNKLKEQRLRPFLNRHGIHNTEGAFDNDDYDFHRFVNEVSLIDNSKLKAQFGTTELNELLFDLRFKTSWVFTQLNGLKRLNNKLEQTLVNKLNLFNQSIEIKRIARKDLVDLLKEEKSIDEVIQLIKTDDKNEPVYIVSESKVNSLGYLLMNEEKYEDALKVFKLNTELFPNAWNTYDSYGECLLKSGNNQEAKRMYQKSLELNPENKIPEI